MIHTTLATLTPDEVRDAFNLVYEGYVIPLRETTTGVSARFAATDIDREHSLVWSADDGAVVGLAALGVRGKRGWIGSFGIAPAWRGQGLSHTLIQAALVQARAVGLTHVQLEVLSANSAAIRTYERAGFARQRDLLVWELTAVPPGAPREPEIFLQPISVERLAPQLAGWHEIPACWQRETASLRQTPGLQGGMIAAGDHPTAGLLTHETGDTVRIADLAGADASGLADAVVALEQQAGEKRLMLVNEPAASPLNAILERRGWRAILRQHEMTIML